MSQGAPHLSGILKDCFDLSKQFERPPQVDKKKQ